MTDKRRDYSTIASVILAMLAFLVSAYAGYSHNDKETAQRITVVETQQKNDGAAINRIEGKVDTLDNKLDKLRDAVIRSLQR